MQCHNCRSQVPEGIAFCQQCGIPLSPPPPSSLAPTVAASQPPYANPGPSANFINPLSIPPTVAASQPPYANPGPSANFINPLSIPPTVAASQPPYANPGPSANFINPLSIPPTVAAPQPPYANPDSGANYNASTVAAPQPSYANPSPYTDYNPSSIPSDDPGYGGAQNPYANVPPYNPYGQSQPSNVPLYAPPPPNNVPPPYSPPPQGNLASYGAEAPAFASPVPVKRKRRVGLIALIVIAILAIVTVGSAVLASKTSPITVKKAPSGNTLDTTASSIVTNIQMASAVDTNTLKPTKLTASFKKDTVIYTTFQFHFSTTDVNQQHPGYVTAKYYKQGTRVFTTDPLKVDDEIAPTGRGYGYFTVQYPYTTTDGAVELYWCRQSTCSDAKLAQTTTFTVY